MHRKETDRRAMTLQFHAGAAGSAEGADPTPRAGLASRRTAFHRCAATGCVAVVAFWEDRRRHGCGDNLATAIWNATKRGLVVDGAIRDMEGIFPMACRYYRGVHPTPIDYATRWLGRHCAGKIGDATVMPGGCRVRR